MKDKIFEVWDTYIRGDTEEKKKFIWNWNETLGIWGFVAWILDNGLLGQFGCKPGLPLFLPPFFFTWGFSEGAKYSCGVLLETTQPLDECVVLLLFGCLILQHNFTHNCFLAYWLTLFPFTPPHSYLLPLPPATSSLHVRRRLDAF